MTWSFLVQFGPMNASHCFFFKCHESVPLTTKRTPFCGTLMDIHLFTCLRYWEPLKVVLWFNTPRMLLGRSIPVSTKRWHSTRFYQFLEWVPRIPHVLLGFFFDVSFVVIGMSKYFRNKPFLFSPCLADVFGPKVAYTVNNHSVWKRGLKCCFVPQRPPSIQRPSIFNRRQFSVVEFLVEQKCDPQAVELRNCWVKTEFQSIWYMNQWMGMGYIF